MNYYEIITAQLCIIILDTNKENNANVQNITGNLPVSNFTLHTNEPCILESDQGCNINCLTNEVSMTNVSVSVI